MPDLATELQAFLDVEVPRYRAAWGDKVDTWDARRDWQRILATGRWSAPAWAEAVGGRGANVTDQLVIEETIAATGLPPLPGMLGLKNVGPTIAVWGTDEQKKHLPKILNAEEIWCQGFSEPGAGSDLAGLRTRAVRDGDEFVVNGQKIWTSNGMYATHMELLVRTNPDAAKHRGISALLVDMSTPGIEVRPIRQITGDAEFAEVFFTDVRIPVADLLGPEDSGWQVTRTTLGHERSGVAVFTARLEKQVADTIAAHTVDGPSPVSPVMADRLVGHYIEARMANLLSRQLMQRLVQGEEPGSEQAVIKLTWSESGQRLAETVFSLNGASSVYGPEGEVVAKEYLGSRSMTIAAGTSQIVKNILSENVLGLPRS
jgi:alkylation response protein AidB-like acyl-CoA dehydrogenase